MAHDPLRLVTYPFDEDAGRAHVAGIAASLANADGIAVGMNYSERECQDCAATQWAAISADYIECAVCGLALSIAEIRDARTLPSSRGGRGRRLMAMPDLAAYGQAE